MVVRHNTPLPFDRAFTLIELAIALTIISLLVAGTMAGSALLSAAKTRGLIAESQAHLVNIGVFHSKYNGLPGDLVDANDYWSDTTSGNGDGNIGVELDTNGAEIFDAWQQILLANIVGLDLSNAGAGTAAILSNNVPSSSYREDIGYSFKYHSAPFSYEDALGGNFSGNYLVLGKATTNVNYLSGNVFTAEEASSLDYKLDDGTPDYGHILGGGAASCTRGTAPSIVYDITQSDIACHVFVKITVF